MYFILNCTCWVFVRLLSDLFSATLNLGCASLGAIFLDALTELACGGTLRMRGGEKPGYFSPSLLLMVSGSILSMSPALLYRVSTGAPATLPSPSSLEPQVDGGLTLASHLVHHPY